MAEYKGKLLSGLFTKAKNVLMSDGSNLQTKVSAIDTRTTYLHENITGTTDATGNLLIHVYRNDYLPFSTTVSNTGAMCFSFFWATNISFYVHVMNADGSPLGNTYVEIDAYYLPVQS